MHKEKAVVRVHIYINGHDNGDVPTIFVGISSGESLSLLHWERGGLQMQNWESLSCGTIL